MILITGATGNFGQEVVKRLIGQNIQFRVMVRNQERAKAIAVPGVER